MGARYDRRRHDAARQILRNRLRIADAQDATSTIPPTLPGASSIPETRPSPGDTHLLTREEIIRDHLHLRSVNAFDAFHHLVDTLEPSKEQFLPCKIFDILAEVDSMLSARLPFR